MIMSVPDLEFKAIDQDENKKSRGGRGRTQCRLGRGSWLRQLVW
jgi:hypothetical protein